MIFIKTIIKFILLIVLIAYSTFFTVSYADNFNIVPQIPLPTSVPEYGTVSAYYSITNTTSSALIGNFVKSLPLNVTQTINQLGYCGAFFDLGPVNTGTDSCILKLTVKAPVNANDLSHPLLVCTQEGVNCNGTTFPLNVTQEASVPFIGMAAGIFEDKVNGFYPLLVKTNDSGDSWNYPREIIDDLTTHIDKHFVYGSLQGATCSGSSSKAVCVASGFYCKTNQCDKTLPLVAVGRDNTMSWSFPHSVFQDLTTRIDPGLRGASLKGGSCADSGTDAFCIIAGSYNTEAAEFPLIALGLNSGLHWSYPPQVFQNLNVAIDPSFARGWLTTASCNLSFAESVCMASGTFCPDPYCNIKLPLIAVSIDKGNTWSYPHSVFENLTQRIDPYLGLVTLNSSSCTGSGSSSICVSAGYYESNHNPLPLIALSVNGGAAWSYPSQIFNTLSTTIGHEFKSGVLNTTSCTGSLNTARCIAAGFYSTSKGVTIPLLALTKDGGLSWEYPSYIYTKLKTEVDPSFTGGAFKGATCIDKDKQSICMAAGQYCAGDNPETCPTSYPLIALTKDGGKTWTYPASVYRDLTTKIDPDYVYGFFEDIHCTGDHNHSFCVASGQYRSSIINFPLLAYSTDNGSTWIYPPYVFKNPTITIKPNYVLGLFNKSATSGGLLLHNLPFRVL